MNLYLAVIAMITSLVALYTIYRAVRLEQKILDSLNRIEKKL